MDPAYGPPSIIFKGRPIRRAVGFVDVGDLTCPDGHRVKLRGFEIREDGALTCSHRTDANRSECGALLWLLLVPGSGRRKHFFAADVEYRELVAWEDQGATLPEVIRYLRAEFDRSPSRG